MRVTTGDGGDVGVVEAPGDVETASA